MVNRRYVAFLVALMGAGFQFFGAMVGQGMLGDGMLFGVAGAETADAGALLGTVAAIVSLGAAVSLMLVRDVRRLAAGLFMVGILGMLAAGTLFGVGAAIAALGGAIALTVDRNASLS